MSHVTADAPGCSEELAEALRAGCASFFGEEKRVFYEASKYLALAKQQFHTDQSAALGNAQQVRRFTLRFKVYPMSYYIIRAPRNFKRAVEL
eukprot:4835156-Pyramimonas_sp.AAC.1